MSIQYPYILQKLTVETSTQDLEGNYIAGTSSWITLGYCRNEDGKQRRFSKDDGSFFVASHLIQCPGGFSALTAGEKIKVTDLQGNVRVQGDVLYSSMDRFHTRIWV